MDPHALRVLEILHHLGGHVPGRIALHKTIYLLQSLSGSQEFQYEWHHYGPYAADLAVLLQQLHVSGLLQDHVYSIELDPQIIAQHYLDFSYLSPDELENLSKLKPIFNRQNPSRWLELVASIHFIRSNLPQDTKPEAIFQHLEKLKPFKFTEDEFNDAWFLLSLIGL